MVVIETWPLRTSYIGVSKAWLKRTSIFWNCLRLRESWIYKTSETTKIENFLKFAGLKLYHNWNLQILKFPRSKLSILKPWKLKLEKWWLFKISIPNWDFPIWNYAFYLFLFFFPYQYYSTLFFYCSIILIQYSPVTVFFRLLLLLHYAGLMFACTVLLRHFYWSIMLI